MTKSLYAFIAQLFEHLFQSFEQFFPFFTLIFQHLFQQILFTSMQNLKSIISEPNWAILSNRTIILIVNYCFLTSSFRFDFVMFFGWIKKFTFAWSAFLWNSIWKNRDRKVLQTKMSDKRRKMSEGGINYAAKSMKRGKPKLRLNYADVSKKNSKAKYAWMLLFACSKSGTNWVR